ncbi:MAG TPA: hypothetical protein ENJ39_02200 [Flammeovirgaceae bacterium]|nr:hypothetical protein [Flammeovirgaceae bacterium]
MKTKKAYITSLVLLIGILILLNVLSQDFFVRLDLTENKRYSLSEATKDILQNLTEPVTVKAYFSDNMPPNIEQVKRDFKDLLVEYANISGRNLVYEFINPNEDPQLEQQINQLGVSPVMINVREKDEVKQQKAYMGAVVEQGDRQEVIPFMQPGGPLEYTLTSAIKKVSVVNKPSVAFIQGHGEPAMQDMQEVMAALAVLYNVEPLNLDNASEIAAKYKAVILTNPNDTIPSAHLQMLDDYLAKGGNLLLAFQAVEGNLQTAYGSDKHTGLEEWLRNKGIDVQDKFVIDANSAMVNVQRQQGAFRITTQIRFPFIPIINKFSNHPIVKGLEAVVMPFVSPVRFTGDSTQTFTPLAMTSDKTGLVSVPTFFDVQRQWRLADFPLANEVVAAALETPGQGKLVVIANGTFAVNNNGGGRPQPLQPDNLSLFVNSVDWLADDTGLIDLRTKAVTSRPIEQLDEDTKTFLKYLNFLLPILLVVIIGLLRAAANKRKRVKRMEMRYE